MTFGPHFVVGAMLVGTIGVTYYLKYITERDMQTLRDLAYKKQQLKLIK